jgi:hypothetical protein
VNRRRIAKVGVMILAMMGGAVLMLGQGPLDSIAIDPGAKTLKEGSISVAAGKGSSVNVVVPGRGIFALDFAVEQDKELSLLLLTKKQYESVAAGRKPDGDPLIRVPIEGVASQKRFLSEGEYVLFVVNNSSTATRLTYRATWHRTR